MWSVKITRSIKKHRINGHVVGYRINDALKYVGLFLNGEKEGIHRYFYSDNKLMFTGNFKNNENKDITGIIQWNT